MSRYVKKGNMLGITGRIQTRNYQDQAGQTHYVTEVVVEAVENLTPRDPNESQPQQNFQQQNQYQGYNNPTYGQQPTYQAPQKQAEEPKSFNVAVDDEELPF